MTPHGPIPGYVVAQYFGFFNGVSKQDYEAIVASAPFEKCNLLILAFVHAVEVAGKYVAEFTNWRDSSEFPAMPGDMDSDRVRLVVKTARAKNPNLKILVSLGWGSNDTGNAATTPAEFADSLAALVEVYGLDGFDIDYESTEVTVGDMLELAQSIQQRLARVTPPRPIVLTITPAQLDGLDKGVLQTFTYTMPQSYDHGGNGTQASWYQQLLGSWSSIVYGLNSEGYVGQSDDPGPFAAAAKSNGAAGIFAWRLDNDSVTGEPPMPTFATGIKMWQLMTSKDD